VTVRRGVRALGAALVLSCASAAAIAAPTVLDLRVTRADGTVAPLRDVIGDRAAVVAFWASYCAPCRAEVPALNRAAERWRDRNVRVLGVALESNVERVRDAQREWDMRYDVLSIAPGQDAETDALFPHGLPTAAFVSRGTATLHEKLLDEATLDRVVPTLVDPGTKRD
jgi:thiol-disulfide isomerase/thioredoxin